MANKRSFIERHKFSSFAISFCFGLVVCLVISSVENRVAVEGQKVSRKAPVASQVDHGLDTFQESTLLDGSGANADTPVEKNFKLQSNQLSNATVNATRFLAKSDLVRLGVRLQI